MNRIPTITRGALVCIATLAALALIPAFLTPSVLADEDGKAAVAALRAPKIIAARFHADWCGECSRFAPNFGKLVAGSSDAPILFVTFDMTNEVTRRQSEYLASLLGLGQVWSAQGNRVGVIQLLDADSKRILASVPVSDGLAKVRKAVKKAAAFGSGG